MRSEWRRSVLVTLIMLLAAAGAGADCLPAIELDNPDKLREAYRQPTTCWPRPDIDAGVQWQELAPLPARPTIDPAKVALGRQLFFDARLSGSGQIPCAHCHDPDLAWGDGRRHPFGHDRTEGNRNSPTLLNTGWQRHFFWDGRAPTLAAQAITAMTSPTEMNADPATVLQTLQDIPQYREQFRRLYQSDTVTLGSVGDALADFVATLTSRPSAFDRFLAGQQDALTDQQLTGLHLFRTKARCLNCHNGPLLSDEQFHNIGMHYYGRKYEDLGRFHISKRQADVGAFKTPGLRDVTLTGPWMHNGMMISLRGVLNFYNRGGFQPRPKPGQENDPTFSQLSPLVKPLQLNREETDALLAFLDSLSTRPTRVAIPPLPMAGPTNPGDPQR